MKRLRPLINKSAGPTVCAAILIAPLLDLRQSVLMWGIIQAYFLFVPCGMKFINVNPLLWKWRQILFGCSSALNLIGFWALTP